MNGFREPGYRLVSPEVENAVFRHGIRGLSIMIGFLKKPSFPEKKELAGSQIIDFPLPGKVILPLSQHAGTPAMPVVQAGSRVRTGQLIAVGEGTISAHVHASVSGKVVSIGYQPHPNGTQAESVVIESDGRDEWTDPVDPPSDPLSSDEIVARVRAAGIVGMGGAAFPTHVKLSPPNDRRIRTVLLNGCECEPYLTADFRVMIEETEKVLSGLDLAMKAVGAQTGIVVVEDNHPGPAEAFAGFLDRFPGVRLVRVPARYPQGAEKRLIERVLKTEVPSGGLPMDIGCLVQNVQTAKAIHEAVHEGKPLIDRVLTVAGGVKHPGNFRVRIGTPISGLIAHCGGLEENVRKLVAGGPMMGLTLSSAEVPVLKGTAGVLALTEREAGQSTPGRCIRCGRCVRACSMGLVPMMVGRMMEQGKLERIDEWSFMDCMECGRCAYECPAGIPLVQYARTAKALSRRKRSVHNPDRTT